MGGSVQASAYLNKYTKFIYETPPIRAGGWVGFRPFFEISLFLIFGMVSDKNEKMKKKTYFGPGNPKNRFSTFFHIFYEKNLEIWESGWISGHISR